jgi:hypothetical protein
LRAFVAEGRADVLVYPLTYLAGRGGAET